MAARLDMWGSAVRMFIDAPLFGSGFGNFSTGGGVFDPFQQSRFNANGLTQTLSRFADALPRGANDLLRTVTPFFGIA